MAGEDVTETPEIQKAEGQLFSKELALKRLAVGLDKMGVKLTDASQNLLTSGDATIIESQESVIKLRNVESNWYPLIYDSQTQLHYYIGIDGQPITVDYEKVYPSIDHGIRSELYIEDTTGYSLEKHQEIVRLTDAAVVDIARLQHDIENSAALTEQDFDESRVTEMSLEEYLSLMKKLSGHFATHLTRVGVREVSGIHSAGQGVYHTSAQKLFTHGSLISPYAAMEKGDVQDDKEFGGEEEIEVKSRCVHVAPEQVDREYTCEVDNIPFVFYPAEVILTNRTSSTRWLGFSPDVTGGNANWEISGMAVDSLDRSNELPVDLGIVFLPKSTPVNPETGSKYEVKDGKGVYSESRVDALEELLKLDVNTRPYQIIEEIRKIKHRRLNHQDISQLNQLRNEFWTIAGFDDRLTEHQRIAIIGTLENWKAHWDGFEQNWNESDDVAKVFTFANYIDYLEHLGVDTSAILDAEKFDADQVNLELLKKSTIYAKLDNARALYEPATNTVPAQEFWEEWFRQHDRRPTRVVYYDGDPNLAIAKFLVEHDVIQPDDVHGEWSMHSGEIRPRDDKLKIPEGMALDIGNFRLHEGGNWMVRVKKNSPNLR